MKALAIVALVLLVPLSACSRGGNVVMTSAPPSPDWAEAVGAYRRDRDRDMRNDPETPLLAEDRAGFRGLDYWPPDPKYRFVGEVELNDRLERFTIVSTSGKPRPCEKFGRVRFELGGALRTLTVYRLLDLDARPGAESLFLPFLDETSGKETYPSGRYVELEGPRGGPYVLDFNLAFNPLCAYGAPERYNCPVTPKENRLPIRIEAGEKGYHHEAAH